MIKTKSFREQKRYLQICFVFIFAASFVGILIERSQINEEISRQQEKKPLPLAEYIKGEFVEQAPGIQDYRNIISVNLFELNKVIDALLAEKDASAYPTEEIYQNFLHAIPPVTYRSMHLAIVGLAKEARKLEHADKDVLASQYSHLYQAYPWLLSVVKP